MDERQCHAQSIGLSDRRAFAGDRPAAYPAQPRLRILAGLEELAGAIAGFDPKYVRGYFEVEAASVQFLDDWDPPSDRERAERLAAALVVVLREWQLEQKAQPKARAHEDIVAFLLEPAVREQLALLARLKRTPPRWLGGRRHVPGAILGADDLDRLFLNLLCRLAHGLFVGCARVDYAMKALLLLTGFTMAFDLQVQAGAHRAGIGGMKTIHYIAQIERQPECAAAQKIAAMAYLVGTAWHEHRDLFERALDITQDPVLRRLRYHPARLFDILFNVQGVSEFPLLALEWAGEGKWFAAASG